MGGRRCKTPSTMINMALKMHWRGGQEKLKYSGWGNLRKIVCLFLYCCRPISMSVYNLYACIKIMQILFSRPLIPHFEISNMGITQSVEAPLTNRDSVFLSGNLGNQNGVGSGSISTTYRRLTSDRGWTEVNVSTINCRFFFVFRILT